MNRSKIEGTYRSFFAKEASFPDAVDIELILTMSLRLKPKPRIGEIWTVLQGYPMDKESERSLSQTRILLKMAQRYKHQYGSEYSWKKALDAYFRLPSKFRLFYQTQDTWHSQTPLVEPASFDDLYQRASVRESVQALLSKEGLYHQGFPFRRLGGKREKRKVPQTAYRTLKTARLYLYHYLMRHEPLLQKPKSYSVKPGTYELVTKKEAVRFYAPVPEETWETVPSLRLKQEWMQDVTPERRLETARQMKEKTGSDKWINQAHRTRLQSMNKRNKPFIISRIPHHLVGGVGVGKNSTIEELIFDWYENRKGQTKALVVLSTVERSLDFHQTLERLGIPSVVLSGAGTKQKHEQVRLNKIIKQAKHVGDVLKGGRQLAQVDSECLLAKHTGLNDQERPFCLSKNNRIRNEKGETCVCPFARVCGMMRPFRQMEEAAVWITNPHAFIQTHVPGFIDQEKRTLQMIAQDWCDACFFDECDETLNVYDSISIQELSLSGKKEHLMQRLYSATDHAFSETQSLYAIDEAQEWKETINLIRFPIDRLTSFIQRNQVFAERLRNKTFTEISILREITEFYQWPDIETQMAEMDQLVDAVLIDRKANETEQNETLPEDGSSSLAIPLKEAVRLFSQRIRPNGAEIEKVCQRFSSLLPLNPRKKSHRYPGIPIEEWLMMFVEFYSYLHEFEFHLRKLVALYPEVSSLLDMEENLQTLFGTHNPMFDLVRKVSTGIRYGYNLKQTATMGKPVYELLLLRNYGDLRSLYVNTEAYFPPNRVQVHPDGTCERVNVPLPCRLFLSGTSYQPKSPHYHVNVRPSHLLTTQRALPSISMFKGFVPTYGEAKDYVHVSGSLMTKRSSQLEKVTEHYIRHVLEKELAYWRERDEKRGILIVVNGYEDAETIGKVLRIHPDWYGRYGFVTKTLHDDDTIRRADLEQVPEKGWDVLIVPSSVLARGYNILQTEKGRDHLSYFGTACFFIRPYYVPDDTQNIHTLLHAHLDEMVSIANRSEQYYEQRMKFFHQLVHRRLRRYLNAPLTMSYLKNHPDLLNELCAFTLTLLIQLTGRMLRGDTDCRILLSDYKFDEGGEEDKNPTMVSVWKAILTDQAHNHVSRSLYRPFMDALENMREYAKTEEGNEELTT